MSADAPVTPAAAPSPHQIRVLPELRQYIDPLTPDEHEALERSLLAEGCRDALVLWGDVLVDGHNRHGICRQHGLPFQTVQNPRLTCLEDVHLWMIEQHLGRRSVSDFQRGVLALRKKDILQARQAALREALAQASAAANQAASSPALPPEPDLPPLPSREALARAARLSTTAVAQIEKIQKGADPELVAAVKAGAVSLHAAAAVASLPHAQQRAAVAGGKKELQQAARQVRQARATRRVSAAEGDQAADPAATASPGSAEAPWASLDVPLPTTPEELTTWVHHLRRTVHALQAELARLQAPAIP